MPSDTDGEAVYRSLRRWLRVIAFALGIGLVAVADIGNVVTNYQDNLLFAVTGVAGGVVALTAAVTLLLDLLPESSAPGAEDASRPSGDDT
ncbi:hypothetical protein ACFQJ5_01755 [Halomicroarcula sp. GCM10025324]|uniref:hypothetical protein n=1 Tax=Haloarcula TaxID=2237 RepID=UPI0023E8A717|nr:hypothetical protein [Halomicroarcula sp. ZS-22-S1]